MGGRLASPQPDRRPARAAPQTDTHTANRHPGEASLEESGLPRYLDNQAPAANRPGHGRVARADGPAVRSGDPLDTALDACDHQAQAMADAERPEPATIDDQRRGLARPGEAGERAEGGRAEEELTEELPTPPEADTTPTARAGCGDDGDGSDGSEAPSDTTDGDAAASGSPADEAAGGTAPGGPEQSQGGGAPSDAGGAPPSAGTEGTPPSLDDLGLDDLVLVDTELAEHQRWGAAAAHVGAAASDQRAAFVLEQAGSGFLTGAGSGFGTGLAIGLGTRVASKAVPVLGPIIGAGVALHGLITGWDATAEAVGKFGEGNDTYEVLANSIDAISQIINVATGILNIINSIVSIVEIAAGVVAAGGTVAAVLTLGAAAPVVAIALEVVATCHEISTGITIVTTVLDGVNQLILQPSVTLFRALHTFTSEADPRDVETQGQALANAAAQSGGALGGLAGGKLANAGSGNPRRPPREEEAPPPHQTPPARGEPPAVHFDEPPALRPTVPAGPDDLPPALRPTVPAEAPGTPASQPAPLRSPDVEPGHPEAPTQPPDRPAIPPPPSPDAPEPQIPGPPGVPHIEPPNPAWGPEPVVTPDVYEPTVRPHAPGEASVRPAQPAGSAAPTPRRVSDDQAPVATAPETSAAAPADSGTGMRVQTHGTPDGEIGRITDAEIDAFVARMDQGGAQSDTFFELPGQNPRTGEGLAAMPEPRINPNPNQITYNQNTYLEGIGPVRIANAADVPVGGPRGPGGSVIPEGVGVETRAPQTQVGGAAPAGNVEVRYHSANPGAPTGSHSAQEPTVQVNTPSERFGWAGNRRTTVEGETGRYLLPDGRWVTMRDATPGERADAHWPVGSSGSGRGGGDGDAGAPPPASPTPSSGAMPAPRRITDTEAPLAHTAGTPEYHPQGWVPPEVDTPPPGHVSPTAPVPGEPINPAQAFVPGQPAVGNNWMYNEQVPNRANVGTNVQRDHVIAQAKLRDLTQGPPAARAPAGVLNPIDQHGVLTVLAETGAATPTRPALPHTEATFHGPNADVPQINLLRAGGGTGHISTDIVGPSREARIAAGYPESSVDRGWVDQLGTAGQQYRPGEVDSALAALQQAEGLPATPRPTFDEGALDRELDAAFPNPPAQAAAPTTEPPVWAVIDPDTGQPRPATGSEVMAGIARDKRGEAPGPGQATLVPRETVATAGRNQTVQAPAAQTTPSTPRPVTENAVPAQPTRSQRPLSDAEYAAHRDFLIARGVPPELIERGDFTAFHPDGKGGGRISVGADVNPLPEAERPGNLANPANAAVSAKGALSHEAIGHREAELAGQVRDDPHLEEAQASVRASLLDPDLSPQERRDLLADSAARLRGRDPDETVYMWTERYEPPGKRRAPRGPNDTPSVIIRTDLLAPRPPDAGPRPAASAAPTPTTRAGPPRLGATSPASAASIATGAGRAAAMTATAPGQGEPRPRQPYRPPLPSVTLPQPGQGQGPAQGEAGPGAEGPGEPAAAAPTWGTRLRQAGELFRPHVLGIGEPEAPKPEQIEAQQRARFTADNQPAKGVERVNPDYPPPPGTPQQVEAMQHEISRLLAARAQAEQEAAHQDNRAQQCVANEGPIQQTVNDTTQGISAAQAHRQSVTAHEAANQAQQQRQQESQGLVAGYPSQAAGLATLSVPLAAWQGFTSLASHLPGDAGTKMLQMNEDANRMQSAFANMGAQMLGIDTQQPARQAELQDDAGRLRTTATEAQGAQGDLQTAQTGAQGLQQANNAARSEAESLRDNATRQGRSLGEQAENKQAEAQTLSEQMQAWAVAHKAARQQAIEATRQRLQAQGKLNVRTMEHG